MTRPHLGGASDGGARCPIEARLENDTFVTVHLDVGIGDVVTAEPQWLTDQDLLGFAGIPPARRRARAREQQFIPLLSS